MVKAVSTNPWGDILSLALTTDPTNTPDKFIFGRGDRPIGREDAGLQN